MRIYDLPLTSRPKEKAIQKGLESLSDAELLALFINTGYKDMNALDIANTLLKHHGSLATIVNLEREQLQREKGIGETKAMRLRAIFEIIKRVNKQEYKVERCKWDPKSFYFAHRFDYVTMNTEKLTLYLLNDKFEFLNTSKLYEGNESGFDVSLKHIFYNAILHNAKYIVLVHNHPSQKSEPSYDDIDFTIRLNTECEKFGIIFLDHLVFTNNDYYSFYENNILETSLKKKITRNCR